MAVIALVPLATALAPSLGAAIGLSTGAIGVLAPLFVGAVGLGAAYLDSTFLYPLLFKQKGVEGPRLDDLRVQTATEGTPYQFVVGTIRTGGTVIWASNLIEKKKTSGGGKKPKQTSYSYSVDIAISFGAGVRRITKLWANGKVIYDLNIGGSPKYDARYTEINLYDGGTTQTASPLIESYEGSGNVSAYRGTCYVTIEGLQLNDFGNGIPQFQALVEQDIVDTAGVPLQEGIETIFKYAGWKTGWYDYSGVDEDKVLRGLLISGIFDMAKALEPLALAFRLVMRETAGVIEIMDRASADVVAIEEEDLGAHTEQPQPAYTVSDPSNKEVPSAIDLRFIDPTNNYDQGLKSERSPVYVSNHTESVDIPIALLPSEARELAMVLLHSGQVEAQTISTSFGPNMMVLQEQDVLTRTLGARTRRLRLTEVSKGWNSMVAVSGYFEQPNSQSGNVVDYDPGDPQPDPVDYTVPYVHILDIAPLRGEDINIPGVYIAASRPSGATEFKAVTVYKSLDGVSYSEAVTCNEESTIGEATTILADQPAWSGSTPEPDPIYALARDDTNTVTVQLWDTTATLETVTDAECKNGKNWMLIGDEVIGFVEATPLGGGEYTLSKLYRGLLNTQHACATHGSDEVACLLDTTLRFAPLPIANRLGTIYYKGVPLYGTPSGFTAFSRVWRAENVKTFRPFAVDVSRSGTDITITWERDSRVPKAAATYGGPLEEPILEFKIAFWEAGADVSITPPLRQIILTFVADAPLEYTYLTADQTTDRGGGSEGDPVKVRISQRGAHVEYGRFVVVDNL